MSGTSNAESGRESSLSLQGVSLVLGGVLVGFIAGWLVFGKPLAGTVALDGPVASPVAAPATAAPAPAGTTGALVGQLAVTRDVNERLGTLPWENEPDYLAYMKSITKEPEAMLKARYRLASSFIQSKELQGNAIEGFLRTPREDFVRAQNYQRAYADTWMPIGYGATITDPDVVSMMTTSLDIQPGHRVLEIGTGSGYQAAILSNMCNYVFSIEIIEPLQKETDALYAALSEQYPQYRNIHRKLGDGYYGWEEYAPFDRIIVTCAIDHLPPPLLKQLAVDGIMVVPLGPPGRQHIMEVKKTKDAQGNEVLRRRDVYNGLQVKFIPFRDESGASYSGKSTE